MKTVNLGGQRRDVPCPYEEKLSGIFMILFEKNVAKQSANDFEHS